MTRFLSESLQAAEPYFRLGLRRLEAANGNPSADIRFTSEVRQATRAKLSQLGLDPDHVSPADIYQALQDRVAADDARLTTRLRSAAATHVSAEGEVVDGMLHILKELPESRRCFALKNSVLRSLLKQMPPKKAMKQLGYRSLDSFIKHESPVLILTAGWLLESNAWQKRFLEQYKKLQPNDFENRSIMLLQPDSAKWRQLSAGIVDHHKHNLISFKEIGALIFLPLPRHIPAGAVTASLSLALHELNEIRAASAFIKLNQTKGNFGKVIQNIAMSEPRLSSRLLDEPVPWHLVQRYYARLSDRFREEIFEPYLQIEDMVWHPIEHTLASIEPAFKFWQETAHLGVLHGRRPVSINLMDTVLNYCNHITFEHRVVHYFQRTLWHELLLRYLHHGPVEQTVLAEFQPQLAAETVKA